MEEFRPEYIQTIEAARWNSWWYVAAVMPLLLLIPAATIRKFGCFAFAAAWFLAWVASNAAIQFYWDAKATSAVNEAEWADANADTARLFASGTTIPISFAYVAVVAALIYGSTAIARAIRKPST